METVDELAGIRWRQGLQARWPRLWLDLPRPRMLGVLNNADQPVPPRTRVLATPLGAKLANLPSGRSLPVPYATPFQLGQGAVELLPSGTSAGGTLVRLFAKNQAVLVVNTASLQALPSAQPLQLREADVLVVDATLADEPPLDVETVWQALHRRQNQQEPHIWLLEHPLLTLDLLLKAQEPLRLAGRLERLAERARQAGLAMPDARKPGRKAQGLLLWPLEQENRLPEAWREVPRTVVAEKPRENHDFLRFTRRIAGAHLDELVHASGCKTVLAWGQGAQVLAGRLTGVESHVLRVPHQLPLV